MSRVGQLARVKPYVRRHEDDVPATAAWVVVIDIRNSRQHVNREWDIAKVNAFCSSLGQVPAAAIQRCSKTILRSRTPAAMFPTIDPSAGIAVKLYTCHALGQEGGPGFTVCMNHSDRLSALQKANAVRYAPTTLSGKQEQYLSGKFCRYC